MCTCACVGVEDTERWNHNIQRYCSNITPPLPPSSPPPSPLQSTMKVMHTIRHETKRFYTLVNYNACRLLVLAALHVLKSLIKHFQTLALSTAAYLGIIHFALFSFPATTTSPLFSSPCKMFPFHFHSWSWQKGHRQNGQYLSSLNTCTAGYSTEEGGLLNLINYMLQFPEPIHTIQMKNAIFTSEFYVNAGAAKIIVCDNWKASKWDNPEHTHFLSDCNGVWHLVVFLLWTHAKQ